MAELYQVATGSKKISNLTVIDGISGSAVIPVVMSNVVGGTYPITNGTTNQISYQDFRESVIENNANVFTTTQIVRVGSGDNQQQTTLEGHDFQMVTGSPVLDTTGAEGFKVQLFANDGTPGAKLYTYDNTEAVAANRFKTFMEIGTGYGDISFTRPVSFSSPLTVNNNLTVNGVLTAKQVQTSIVTSSVQFESGSTRFGDTFEDTHEFTGSLKTSGSISLNTLTQNRVVYVGSNGTLIDSSAFTFNGTTLGVQAGITTTGYVNINGNGLKVDGVINNPLIGAVTQSLIDITGGLQAYTASLKSVAIVSSSNQLFELNNQTGSQNSINTLTAAVTSSLITIVGGLQSYTASLKSVGIVSSSNQLFELNNQTGSQDGVNLGISIVTASLNAYTASGVTSTSNINSFTASQIQFNLNTSASTGSLNAQTASQDSVNNLTLAVTSSLITIVGGLQSYTASLKSVSIVSSSNQLLELNNQTGSQNSVNNLTSAVTSSLITIVGGLQGYTASLKAVAIVSSSNQLFELNNQTGSQDSVNNLTSAVTSSLITIVGGLQSYTASLKGVAIVSSSQQILNYNIFATTGSNTFVGNQTITGSLNVTSSVNLSGSVVINGFTYPTFGFTDGQYGVEVPTLATNNVFSMEVPKTIYEYVKNDSGVTLLKGTPVHSTGTVGFNTLVIAASASVASTMPATYILAQDLDDEEEGLGIAIGAIQGIDTTTFVAGDPVYVGVDGGFTQSKPTGSNLIQNLGIVTKVGVNGGGVVLGAGRANDVPNIQEGYFWVGNSGSVATATPTSSFALTGSNTFVGNQTITGSLNLTGSININNVITMTPVTTLPVGQAGMLVASSSYGSTNLYIYDGADWKWLVTGSIV